MAPLPNYEITAREYLNKHSIEIKNADDYSNLNDLRFLKKPLQHTSIVALGESTHGTKEFFTMRNRIILYLIDSLNFSIVLFENNFSATHEVNSLLTNPGYDSRAILDSLFIRVYQTSEMSDLLDQLKRRISRTRQIYIEGYDNQDFFYVQKSIKNKFRNVDPYLYTLFSQMDKYSSTGKDTSAKYDSLYRDMQAFMKEFAIRKKAFGKKFSASELTVLTKMLTVFQNSIYFFYLQRKRNETKSKFINSGTYRDSIMADNILWIKNFYPGRKIIIIGHNQHIEKAKTNDFAAMGSFLDRKVGRSFKTYGFFSAEGTVTGYSRTGVPIIFKLEKPDQYDYEYYFAKSQNPLFFLPIKTEAKKEKFLYSLSGRAVGFLPIENQFSASVNLYKYDGIFFIRNTSNTLSFHVRENNKHE
jgi:erythromycin esterase